MHDRFLKSFYADRDTVEILIREHVPEWVGEIDCSTLREEPTALVSRKTLEQRHPDMIWSAAGDGGRVLFMVEFQRKAERLMRTMLELRDYAGRLNLGGARTMDEMAERFQRGLDELVERGAREGRREGAREGRREGVREGRREGRVTVLRRQIARRFGEETAGRVSDALDGLPGPEVIDTVTDALFECGTGEEFVERVGTG